VERGFCGSPNQAKINVKPVSCFRNCIGDQGLLILIPRPLWRHSKIT
jgi:hypothetical protein